MNAETLRLLLAGSLVAMYVLAMLFLRRQPLTFSQYTLWGLLALFVPALGPFLVILLQPGKTRPKENRSVSSHKEGETGVCGRSRSTSYPEGIPEGHEAARTPPNSPSY